MSEFLFLIIGIGIGGLIAYLWLLSKMKDQYNIKLDEKQLKFDVEKELRLIAEAELKANLTYFEEMMKMAPGRRPRSWKRDLRRRLRVL